MNDLANIQLIFPDHEKPIHAHDLGEFLKEFSDIYDAASTVTHFVDEPELIILDPSKYISETIDTLSRDAEMQEMGFELYRHDLVCSKISYSSPLEIWFAGTVSALALAVIVAGGEIKLFGVSIKLKKSLGEALADLRKVRTQAKVREVSRTRAKKAQSQALPPSDLGVPVSGQLPSEFAATNYPEADPN